MRGQSEKMKLIPLFLLAGMLAVSGCAKKVLSLMKVDDRILIASSEFLPSEKIKYQVGKEYGWKMVLKNEVKTIKVTETLTLPGAPKTWGPEPVGSRKREISSDLKTCITTDVINPADGKTFSSYWSIAKGDPIGDYKVDVSINGKHIQTFNFNIYDSSLTN
ncbi:unannotated protein [freshwater metagenome]|uniref:Unannotated protein n=1 Tax=freshwater metagenome TaxID=449393 RepID=A0A6J7RWP1_9ZZZZ